MLRLELADATVPAERSRLPPCPRRELQVGFQFTLESHGKWVPCKPSHQSAPHITKGLPGLLLTSTGLKRARQAGPQPRLFLRTP